VTTTPADRDTTYASAEHRPPQHPDAEQAVLGALLLDPSHADALAAELEGRDFYQPAHELIWDAAHTIAADADRTLDPITLKDQLERAGDLARVGGAPYLHTLLEACPTPCNASYYAGLVRDASRLRQVEAVATRLHSAVRRG
jgi:replicative DNA helicase